MNVLSAAAWLTVDGNTAYAAAKSAEWGGLTNGVRVELAGQGTQVVGLMPGLIGTETLLDFARSAGIEFPDGAVTEPAALVELALDGLEAGDIEIADAIGQRAKQRCLGHRKPSRSEATRA